jgi:enoyl-CoA hydratase
MLDIREATAGVKIVELAHGKVNALDVEVLDALDGVLAALSTDGAVTAIVLTGAGSVFSAGVDLRRVVEEDPAYAGPLISGLSRTLEALFAFAKPTVCAVNGPAIAGGCVLACACDWRIAAEDVRLGANELAVGVSLPASALEIMRFSCGDHSAEVLYGAEILDAKRAREVGILDEVVASGNLLDRAVEVAGKFGSIDPEAFGLAKQQLRRPALELMRSGASKIDDAVTRQWASPSTRAQLTEQLQKLKKA